MKRLEFHTQPEPGSFLEMLRPYKGIREEVLVDLSRSLRAAAPLFGEARVARVLVSSVWAIAHLGRLWALEPDGMLRRNKLISDSDRETLATFIDRLEYAVMMLLDGAPEEAFADWPDGI